jgi:hypothetical protein
MGMMDEPTFDKDGYPTDETLAVIRCWSYEEGFWTLMEFVKEAWSDYGWLENCPSKIEPIFKGEEDDGRYWCGATGGWSGNESILAALEHNVMFSALCWNASVRGGYHEYHIPKMNLKSK